MLTIKIGNIGKIVKGDDVGNFVKIIDDSQNTGGFLIITSANQAFEEGYDDWVENEESLIKYFTESKWEIEWL